MQYILNRDARYVRDNGGAARDTYANRLEMWFNAESDGDATNLARRLAEKADGRGLESDWSIYRPDGSAVFQFRRPSQFI